ncbi:MAG: PadR family transcriptional regulator [Acidimicrobiales bacterium]
MLELAILGLLKERPMHGYDLRKRLRNGCGLLASLSFGSLYPALARLERANAVREVGTPVFASGSAEVIPLTGSLSGEKAAWRARLAARAANTARTTARSAATAPGTRGRKVYELTPVGEEMFAALLIDEPDRQSDDKSFALRWSFARHMSSDSRLRLLERHRRRLEDRLASAKRAITNPQSALDRYEHQVAAHAVDSLNKDLSWVESLLAAEQSPAGARVETDAS